MSLETIRSRIAWLAAVGVVMASPPSVQAEDATHPDKDQTAATSEERVQKEGHEEWAKRQNAILEEARTSLEQTHAALTALENGDEEAALDALALAAGKLEILLARDPTLALAPIDVDFETDDLYATVDSVRAAREQASDLLDDGRVQEARALLSGLASEFVIRVTNIPLATWPDAIKAVSPLIDEGKLDEAKRSLRAVLDTLVVTQQVIPLPVARASHMLEEAKSLLAKSEGTETGDQKAEAVPGKIEELVKGARRQLEMAEVLGYGRPADYEKFQKQIAELEQKIGSDQKTEGIFARLQKSLEGFRSSFVQ